MRLSECDTYNTNIQIMDDRERYRGSERTREKERNKNGNKLNIVEGMKKPNNSKCVRL